jgi:mono/diheme cytochrome c family protein
MFAWAGSKHQDGGFYRIRAATAPPNLPVELKASPHGMELGFTNPLDKESASATDNYKIKIWGLKRTKDYGSRHYDERPLEVAKATVSEDGKNVFLTIPELSPTWGMEIKINIKDENGEKVERVIHNTIHQLGDDKGQTSKAPDVEEQDPHTKQETVDYSELRNHAIGLMEKHCLECHDSSVSKGDLDIETALDENPLVKSHHLWVNVLERIRNGEMPPEDEPQPSEAERQALVDWVNREVIEFDYTTVKDPGYELARRLSHAEYNNTVHDLFGVNVRPADEFPHDLRGVSGFSNSANTLFIQPTLLERYISAAEEVVNAALPDWHFAKESDPNKLFRVYLRRAYRRPASDAEVGELVARYQAARELGHLHVAALKPALIFSLISPNFLFRIESAPSGPKDHRITDWELASRLSYFIWASTPDDALLDLAAAGKLRDPDIIREQVQRMLRDERSGALGHEFASQWLKFEHVGTRVRLDPIDSPWCTDTLMKAMRDESAHFIHSLVQENQPIHRLINANYTFLNEELARHYRIMGIKGEHMRRVTLNDNRRGGIFGHGSVLAVTSFPGRTSPVVRGTYILDDILGTPPPPPPPDAGELENDEEGGQKLTLKQKLEVHRSAPQCAGCHARIDPLGFSLENYDWFGRYRDRYRGKPIDSEGQLPNGHEFSGLSGLREVIISQRLDDLTRQITRKLLSFGLGRQLDYYDELATQQILAAVKRDGYRFHTLINGIVNSYPFQWKRLPERSDHN